MNSFRFICCCSLAEDDWCFHTWLGAISWIRPLSLLDRTYSPGCRIGGSFLISYSVKKRPLVLCVTVKGYLSVYSSSFCFLEDEHQIKSRYRNVTAAFLENVLNDCEEEYVWNNVLESNNRQFEKHLSCWCHDWIETKGQVNVKVFTWH